MRKLWAFLSIGDKYRRNTFRQFSLLCEIGDSLTVQCQITGPSPIDVRFVLNLAAAVSASEGPRESFYLFLMC